MLPEQFGIYPKIKVGRGSKLREWFKTCSKQLFPNFLVQFLNYSLFQKLMCIPLICMSNRCELVQTYYRENVQQMTHVIFCKLLLGTSNFYRI